MATANKTCPKCGRSYPANLKFCERDGSELILPGSPESASKTTASAVNLAPPKNALSRETMAGGIIVLILVLIVGIVFGVREAGCSGYRSRLKRRMV